MATKKSAKKGSRKKRWRDAYHPDEVVQRVRPRESSDYLHNPHRGTTTFQRFQGDALYPGIQSRDTFGPVSFKPAPKRIAKNARYVPMTTLAYCRWPWRWLEPKKGVYRWDIIENSLKAAHDRGQSLQVRFQPFTEERVPVDEAIASTRRPPGTAVDVPDWYWDTGAKWVLGSKRGDYEPDHNDPLYIKHFGSFIRAFAKKFDGHPDLESIDIAYAGHWGESGGNSNKTTAIALVDIYLKSFRKTQLLSMLGTHGCAYAAQFKNRHVGWRADCFGDLRANGSGRVPDRLAWNHMYSAYPKEIVLNGVQDAWKTAPVTMETCGNVATWHQAGYDFDWIVEQGMKYHMSVFMPKSVYYPDDVLEKMISFDKKIGYRFVIRDMLLPMTVKPGGRVRIEIYLDNVGCAPIYRPYTFAYRFRQGKQAHIVHSKQDIRTWMPNTITWFKDTITVPRELTRGEVALDVGIVGDDDAPRVRFAIQETGKDGWHPMTFFDVED